MDKRIYPFNLLSEYICEYYNLTEDIPYEIMEIPAIELFVPGRIDLAAKYYLIQSLETNQNVEFAKDLYIKHIEAFSDGRCTEHGNADKNSAERYLETFCHLMENIKEHGVDPERSLIPVGYGNVLLDGSHRVACAAYFGQKVTIVKFPTVHVRYDYRFFRKRVLDEAYLEFMVHTYCMLKKDSYVAFIWPQAYRERKYIVRHLRKNGCRILYDKKMKMSYDEFFSLIYQVYKKEPWVGSKRNHYRGVALKSTTCYEKHGQFTILIFDGISKEKAVLLKKAIRKRLGRGKQTFHIADSWNEARNSLLILEKMRKENWKLLENFESMKPHPVDVVKREVRNIYACMLHRLKRLLGMPT